MPVRDAATLVIVDRGGVEPRLLVGRRAAGHVFMASKLVFPGGRIDHADLRLAPGFALDPAALRRLTTSVRATFTQKRAVALALAAIRETFEETGVMIGVRDDTFTSKIGPWRDFAAEGVRPDPAALMPFARAVTPPRRVRRYDTRFFAVDASTIARAVPFEQRPTDEFDRVEWMSLPQMAAQDLAPITRVILDDLIQLLAGGRLDRFDQPIPFYRGDRSDFARTLL